MQLVVWLDTGLGHRRGQHHGDREEGGDKAQCKWHRPSCTADRCSLAAGRAVVASSSHGAAAAELCWTSAERASITGRAEQAEQHGS